MKKTPLYTPKHLQNLSLMVAQKLAEIEGKNKGILKSIKKAFK